MPKPSVVIQHVNDTTATQSVGIYNINEVVASGGDVINRSEATVAAETNNVDHIEKVLGPHNNNISQVNGVVELQSEGTDRVEVAVIEQTESIVQTENDEITHIEGVTETQIDNIDQVKGVMVPQIKCINRVEEVAVAESEITGQVETVVAEPRQMVMKNVRLSKTKSSKNGDISNQRDDTAGPRSQRISAIGEEEGQTPERHQANLANLVGQRPTPHSSDKDVSRIVDKYMRNNPTDLDISKHSHAQESLIDITRIGTDGVNENSITCPEGDSGNIAEDKRVRDSVPGCDHEVEKSEGATIMGNQDEHRRGFSTGPVFVGLKVRLRVRQIKAWTVVVLL